MQRRTFLAGLSAATLAGLTQTLHSSQLAWADPVTAPHAHPRLLLHSFAPAAQLVADDTAAAGWYDDIEAVAQTLLDTPVSTHDLSSGDLLTVAREVVHRVYVLGFSHGIGGDQRYLDRLWAELEAVCAFPNWNTPQHWLDAAELAHAVAIGYDWFHDSWTPAQRSTMETALVDLALTPGLALYESQTGWVIVEDNWNIVCNGGLIVAALALLDVRSDLATSIIEHALASLPRALTEYAPDGGYAEGVGSYWHYATKYLVLTIAALESARGDDAGLGDSPGVSTTGDFPIHLTGPTGNCFNYYDAGKAAPKPPELFWLAARYDHPVQGWWGRQGADTRAPSWTQSPASLIWYDPTKVADPVTAGTPLDAHFALCQVFTSRNGWLDTDAVFVAGKGGDNATNHSDLDLGDFVLEALGVRWACELGPDSYALPGYFDEDDQRWTYYRKRAEGQNTLVFNPGYGPDQRIDATGGITRRESAVGEHLVVADLSEASDAVTSWHRGWRLFDERRQVLVQDEFSVADPVDAWWFLHTEASISIATDGRSASLSRSSGQSVTVRLLQPAGATFLQTDAGPLWTSPDPAGQTPNPTVRKLVVHLPAADDTRIAVQFTPRHPGQDLPDPAQTGPLADWHVDTTPTATLASITVDGAPLPDFDPRALSYTGEVPSSADLHAVAADAGGDVVVSRSGVVTTLTVSAPGRAPARYRIQPSWALHWEDPRNWSRPVVASGDDGNVPEFAVDGDPSTRWSAQGDGQWIGVDLGAEIDLDEVGLAWYRGDTRRTRFDIEVATEADPSWQRVLTATSSGSTVEVEQHPFTATAARYLRIVGHGGPGSDWNSLSQLVVPGRDLAPEPSAPRLAALDVGVSDVGLGATTTATLSATRSDGSPAPVADTPVTWISTDPQVATIDAEGLVHALTEGTTTIAAVVVTDDHRLLHDRRPLTVTDPDHRRHGCVADTYVRDGSTADTVFGSWSTISVKSSPSPGYTRVGYLAFDPGSSDRTISSVVLSVHGAVTDSRGDSATLDVTTVDGDITESATTWTNRPTLGAGIGQVTLGRDRGWHQIDLTEALRGAVASGERVVLGLTQLVASDVDGLSIELSSRSTSMAPFLEVRLSG